MRHTSFYTLLDLVSCYILWIFPSISVRDVDLNFWKQNETLLSYVLKARYPKIKVSAMLRSLWNPGGDIILLPFLVSWGCLQCVCTWVISSVCFSPAECWESESSFLLHLFSILCSLSLSFFTGVTSPRSLWVPCEYHRDSICFSEALLRNFLHLYFQFLLGCVRRPMSQTPHAFKRGLCERNTQTFSSFKGMSSRSPSTALAFSF